MNKEEISPPEDQQQPNQNIEGSAQAPVAPRTRSKKRTLSTSSDTHPTLTKEHATCSKPAGGDKETGETSSTHPVTPRPRKLVAGKKKAAVSIESDPTPPLKMRLRNTKAKQDTETGQKKSKRTRTLPSADTKPSRKDTKSRTKP